MSDDIPRGPIRELAHDAATDAVPARLRPTTLRGVVPDDATPGTTFDDFAAVVGDVADDIERALRAEVDA